MHGPWHHQQAFLELDCRSAGEQASLDPLLAALELLGLAQDLVDKLGEACNQGVE